MYVKGEYQDTLQTIKHYLRREHKLNRDKISSNCKKLRCIYINAYINIMKNNENVVLHYVKVTNPLSFQTRFPKSGPTCRYNMQCLIHGTKRRTDNQW